LKKREEMVVNKKNHMNSIKEKDVKDKNKTKNSTFNLEDFELEQVFKTSVFGKWIDIYVFVDIDDYNRLKDEQANR
jgi:hypothetical protein